MSEVHNTLIYIRINSYSKQDRVLDLVGKLIPFEMRFMIHPTAVNNLLFVRLWNPPNFIKLDCELNSYIHFYCD